MTVIFLFWISTFQPLAAKNQQPIKVIINDWTSQIVLAHITGQLFEYIGYKVEYSFATSNEQWGSLSHGIDHVQIEVWQGTMSEMFDRMVKAGRILDAGSHNAITREDWWYPTYVEEFCPGLPDWKALKRCAPLFSNDSGKKGVYLAGPWEKPEGARIRALALDFIVQTVKEADELWRALASAQKERRPIVLFNWTPNWVEAVYDGKFVEFPEYHPDCETDPSWGINKTFHYDCGNPRNGWLKKAAWSEMPNRWPCAYQVLTNINFDNQAISQIAAQVDFHKRSHRQVAKDWIVDNQKLWLSWIPDSCMQRVQER